MVFWAREPFPQRSSSLFEKCVRARGTWRPRPMGNGRLTCMFSCVSRKPANSVSRTIQATHEKKREEKVALSFFWGASSNVAVKESRGLPVGETARGEASRGDPLVGGCGGLWLATQKNKGN